MQKELLVRTWPKTTDRHEFASLDLKGPPHPQQQGTPSKARDTTHLQQPIVFGLRSQVHVVQQCLPLLNIKSKKASVMIHAHHCIYT